MNKNVRQIVLPLLASAIWGAAFLAQGNLSSVLPPFFINFFRSLIAVFSLLVVDLIFTQIKKSKGVEIQKVNVKKLVIGGVCCGLSLCGAVNVQQIGIGGSTSGEAAFITTLYMILVPVMGVFFKRKVGLNIWISVVIAVIGLALICQVHSVAFKEAYIYLICSAIFFAIQILFVDYFVQFVDGVKLSCAQFLVASVVSGIISLCTEDVNINAVGEGLLPLLYLGIFSSAVGYTLQIVAQKGTNPTVVSLILSLESAFALVFGVLQCLILQKPITETPLQFLGCFLMLSAIILSQVNPFKKLQKKSKTVENVVAVEENSQPQDSENIENG